MLPHCIPMEYILKSQPFHCFIDVANSTQFTHHHDHWPHRYAGVPQAYALRSVLERFANYDWFLWLDCDIIITDVTQRVESILASPLDEAKETCPVKQPRLWAFRACCLKQEFALRRDRCILPRNVDAKHQRWSFFFLVVGFETNHHWSVQVMQPLNCPWCWSVQIDGGFNLIWFC